MKMNLVFFQQSFLKYLNTMLTFFGDNRAMGKVMLKRKCAS